MQNFVEICAKMVQLRLLKQNVKWRPPPYCILLDVNFDFITSCGTSFSVSASNLVEIYAITAKLLSVNVSFKMAATAILDFVVSQI